MLLDVQALNLPILLLVLISQRAMSGQVSIYHINFLAKVRIYAVCYSENV